MKFRFNLTQLKHELTVFSNVYPSNWRLNCKQSCANLHVLYPKIRIVILLGTIRNFRTISMNLACMVYRRDISDTTFKIGSKNI